MSLNDFFSEPVIHKCNDVPRRIIFSTSTGLISLISGNRFLQKKLFYKCTGLKKIIYKTIFFFLKTTETARAIDFLASDDTHQEAERNEFYKHHGTSNDPTKKIQ